MARAELIENLEETEVEEVTEDPVDQDPNEEEDIPEKYRGKSAAEIIRMHQEAERLIGRQSQEVGELRRWADTLIQTNLEKSKPKEEAEEVDFFTDPKKATEHLIDNHPKVRQAEEAAARFKQQEAERTLKERHPDMMEILANPDFAEWIKGSPTRTRLYVDADRNYDYDAADELFTTWKERQQVVQKTVEAERGARTQAAKNASTGNARGSTERSKKVFRRSDIIKLMREDPDRYDTLQDEILQAYREGRVK